MGGAGRALSESHECNAEPESSGHGDRPPKGTCDGGDCQYICIAFDSGCVVDDGDADDAVVDDESDSDNVSGSNAFLARSGCDWRYSSSPS